MIPRFKSVIPCMVHLFLLCCFAPFGMAQNTTGSISGVVTDPSGAVVVGADVHVASMATGTSRDVKSNSYGEYIVPQLSIGDYSISVTKQGFKTETTSNVQVQILSTLTVNFALEVGGTSQKVDVHVASAQTELDTQTSQAGTVIEGHEVNDLPLNVRQYMQLIFLAPMAIPAANDYRSNETPRNTEVPAAAGQMPENNNYQIDGMDNLETGRNNWNVAVPVDSVQEFRVQTGMPPAEFGRGGGAIINVVTRSGTDHFHGSAYEFARNQTFDATPDFATSKSPLNRNQFGGSVGGPLLHRTIFFFGNYEGLRQTSTVSPPTGEEPTQDERNGIFTSTIIDPSTGAPFPNNTIPSQDISPISQYLLQLFPLPNITGNPAYNYSFQNVPAVQDNYDYGVGRVDFAWGQKDTAFARYLYDKEVNGTPPNLPPPANADGSHLTLFNQGGGGQWNHIFSAGLLNTLSVSYERYHQVTTTLNSYVQDFITPSGITDTLSATNALFWAVPTISITGILAPSDPTPSTSVMNNYQLQDSVVFTRGRHTMKLGGDLQRIETDMFFTGGNGYWDFLGTFTGNPVADYLLGYPESVSKTLTATAWDTWMNYGSMFFGDDWRVTHKLTLNLGLRYEVETAINMSDHCGMQMNLVNGLAYQVIPNTCKSLAAIQSFSQNVNPSILLQTTNHNAPYDTDWKEVAPRFGLAYSVTPKTVLHAGFGVFYADPQVSSTASTNDYAPDDLAPAWTNTTSTPRFGWNPEGVETGVDALGKAPLTVFPYLSRNAPYGQVQEWMLNVEHDINNSLSLQLLYQGSVDHHLLIYNNADWVAPGPGNVQTMLPYPQYARIQDFEPSGFSNFNGVSVRLEQAPWHGLNYLFSYTFSKSLDNASTMNEGPQWTDPYHQKSSAYGPSEFNVPNRISLAYGYAFPLGSGQALFAEAHGALNEIISGWGTRGIYQLQNGVPQSASMNLSNVGMCAAACTARAYLVPGQNPNLPRSQRTAQRFYNVNAFEVPATPTYQVAGEAGRDDLKGPPTNKWDAQLYKDFPIREGQNIEFRWEIYNVLNHPQWAQPSTNAQSPATFGVITGVVSQSWRIMQFALRYQF